LNESLENPILKFGFQRKILRYLHISCTWFLLDDEVCKRLKIPEVPFRNAFPNSKRWINKIYDTLLIRKSRIEKGNKDQMQVLEDYLKITKHSNFH